jgi:nitrite reductase/ring-hydroxylating ferredoxin subunit
LKRHRIAALDDLAPGQVMRVEVEGRALCLAHVRGLGFFAVDDRCTHEDTELSDGELDGVEIECPLHGSRFDVTTGEVRGLPATVPTNVYPVVVDDRMQLVFVEL